MARRRSTTRSEQDELPEDFTEHIVDIDVTQEMETSFLEYSYSVIYSRALPDARDGLKPVQRRILFMMDQMGLRPDRGHVKSARVVGEVMGKLHPHGDSAIYDAMVRMAQSFAMRLPLVDGHGNFGSLDDGPAAPRYTEARMAPAAQALTGDLDEDVVDFVPNYDNQFQQPGVLPAAYPALLVNGATGIAVGMATNMAPHNLREVVAGARHLILNPEATLEDLMKFVPGPDLPRAAALWAWKASVTLTAPVAVPSRPEPRSPSNRFRPANRASWSPNCPTWWARKRSPRRSRTPSSPRSWPASRTWWT